MKRFLFSLQTVLDLREREEDEVKQELAEKENELRQKRLQVEETRDILIKYMDDQKIGRAANQSVVELRHSVSWRHKLKVDISNAGKEFNEVMVDIDHIRARLVKATAKRKMMDILKDKQYEQWKKERERKDQQFLDELASNAHIRKKKLK